jgi:hypothetical protein
MRKVQPVSFNLADPFESKLYMYALSNGAFSKYVKRLIMRDQEGEVIKQPKLETETIPILKPKGKAASFI